MTSLCSPPVESSVPPPRTSAPRPLIPPPLLPDPLDLSFPLAPCSLQTPIPPPPPLPPPPATVAAPPLVYGLEKHQLLKEALEKASPNPKGREDVKRLLKLHKDRCGLVALWMAGALLSPPSGVPLETLVQVAMDRGYTAQGEMFSGVLLGVQVVPSLGYAEDPELPGLFHPMPSMPCQPPPLPKENTSGTIFLLCKQGKSWHYQLWDYDQVQESNLQLTDFSPSRAADGRDDSHISAALRRRYCFPAHVREEETEPQECKSCAQGHNRARPHPHATWL
ncbi:UPF0692 protein C19orf54 homolog isoform X6 [Heterocephalus glaber]|uniref:Actin maturation protease n=1 Tax=Heterocephalus glaber TaxID=10181 RepID=A0AAX6SEZ5_HETGA|nr:UPF0692 protein C19orf54 homolog isoform X6 [Heterocephalus glaber]